MITAIVLAAGRSRRMGEQKLLLPLGDKRVICRVVDELLASPVDEVLVVVGHDQEKIEQALTGRPVRYVVNPKPGGEMLDSVRCGLKAMAPETEAALIVLGDQPRIRSTVVAELIRTHNSGHGGMVVPTFQGKRGHPLLLSARYRDEILSSFDDVGLRGLLGAHPEEVVEVELPAPEVLEDMDARSDYERIRRTYDNANGYEPTEGK